MKKIITIDLDGTLLDSQKQVSAYTRKVIKEGTLAGHAICLCSGRPYSSMIQLVDDLEMNIPGTYTICYNGGMIFKNDTKEPVFETYLNIDSFGKIWNYAKKAGLQPQSYSVDSVVVDEDAQDVVEYAKRIKIKYQIVENILEFDQLTPFKIVIIDSKNPKRLHEFRKIHEDKIPKDCYGLFTERTLLEYIPSHVSKGQALKKLADLLGIDMANSYAIGDAENDLSMIQKAHVGIAMANGIELIKKQAQVVLDKTNDEDGVAYAIEKYILNKEMDN